ncbi:hypothetical protein J2X01_003447 [Arthrobacter ginsengisoli]|uniref:Glyoxalase-like domain-containing protein n=1 Tax=Arthrobacter ginsengisoli TaxID=1356565 RepID=A0ABU1UG17_9MICC|nr:VOC family protein [Arthrobacter ginsengisoli]MDR7084139.1 hypothetical protein [Arthrobacter ginsengisoli]
MDSGTLPEFRQLVLLTSDLEGTLARARKEFGVPEGFRDPVALAKVGMQHEVFGFDRTYVEVCEPINPESSASRSLARKGDSGFMVVLQVPDAEAMVTRAKGLGLEPLVVKDHHGSVLSQWHPRDFGTIAEFDEMRPADSWHFAPDIYEARNKSVVDDIVAVHLSVAEPAAMAERWAAVSGGAMGSDGTSVQAGRALLRFATVNGASGVYAVDCRAADPNRVGETVRLSGVDFVFV